MSCDISYKFLHQPAYSIAEFEGLSKIDHNTIFIINHKKKRSPFKMSWPEPPDIQPPKTIDDQVNPKHNTLPKPYYVCTVIPIKSMNS